MGRWGDGGAEEAEEAGGAEGDKEDIPNFQF